jgi:hypothetical protein
VFQAITLNPQGVNVGNAMEAVGSPQTGGGASFVCGNTLNVVQRSRYGSRALNNMTRDIPRARNLTVQTGQLMFHCVSDFNVNFCVRFE